MSWFSKAYFGASTEDDVRDCVSKVEAVCRDGSAEEKANLLRTVVSVGSASTRSQWGYRIGCEVLQEMIEAFRYDAGGLQTLYQCASSMGYELGQAVIGCRSSLTQSHVWSNIPIWVDMTDHIVANDLLILDSIYSSSDGSPSSSLLFDWDRSESKAVFLCNRIISVLLTMRGMGLRQELLHAYLQAVITRYRLQSWGSHLLVLHLYPFVNEILEKAVQAISVLPSKYQSAEDVISAAVRPAKYQETRNGIADNTLLSLLYLSVAVKILRKNGDISVPDTPVGRPRPTPSRHTCVCGRSIHPWHIVGNVASEEMLLQSKLVFLNVPVPAPLIAYQVLEQVPFLMCELCYRDLYNCQLDLERAAVSSTTEPSSDDGMTDPVIAAVTSQQIFPRVAVGHCPSLAVLTPPDARKTFSQRLKTLPCQETEVHLHKLLRVPYQASVVPATGKADSHTQRTPQREDKHARTTPSTPLSAPPPATTSPRIAATQQPMVSRYTRDDRGGFEVTSAAQTRSAVHTTTQSTTVSTITAASTMYDDDASVMSGFSRMDEDDVSVARFPRPVVAGVVTGKTRVDAVPEEVPLAAPMERADFHEFIRELWRGLVITLVYSHQPPIEKTRVLYVRSDSSVFDDLLMSACAPTASARSPSFLQVVTDQRIPLYLGWARKSELGHIVWNAKKSIPANAVRNVKVGSKRWKNCIKLGTDSKIIVIKIDDDARFHWVMRGLTQLVDGVADRRL